MSSSLRRAATFALENHTEPMLEGMPSASHIKVAFDC